MARKRVCDPMGQGRQVFVSRRSGIETSDAPDYGPESIERLLGCRLRERVRLDRDLDAPARGRNRQ